MTHETLHEPGCPAVYAWDIPGACTCGTITIAACDDAMLVDWHNWCALSEPRPDFLSWRKSAGGAPTQEGE